MSSPNHLVLHVPNGVAQPTRVIESVNQTCID